MPEITRIMGIPSPIDQKRLEQITQNLRILQEQPSIKNHPSYIKEGGNVSDIPAEYYVTIKYDNGWKYIREERYHTKEDPYNFQIGATIYFEDDEGNLDISTRVISG